MPSRCAESPPPAPRPPGAAQRTRWRRTGSKRTARCWRRGNSSCAPCWWTNDTPDVCVLDCCRQSKTPRSHKRRCNQTKSCPLSTRVLAAVETSMHFIASKSKALPHNGSRPQWLVTTINNVTALETWTLINRHVQPVVVPRDAVTAISSLIVVPRSVESYCLSMWSTVLFTQSQPIVVFHLER